MMCASLQILAAEAAGFGCIAAAMFWLYRRASRALDRMKIAAQRERPSP